MTVRVGVVGSGFMGRTWAEVAAHQANGTSLSAVTGGTRAAALAADFDVPLEPDLDALLARDDIDAVVLATPPAVHLEQTLAAAAAGRHLLVEKPMAQSASECAKMVEACRRGGVRLAVVSQHRFRDAPVAAKRLIDDGTIGDVRIIQVTGAEVGWWDLKARGDEWKLDPRQQTGTDGFRGRPEHGDDDVAEQGDTQRDRLGGRHACAARCRQGGRDAAVEPQPVARHRQLRGP